MNRFIKKNLFLTGVMAFSALGIVILLILSGLQYIEMVKYSVATKKMMERKRNLENQRPAAIRENITRLQQDIDGYTAAYDSMKKYFGQTLHPALESFVAKLNEASLANLYDDMCEVSDEFRKMLEQSHSNGAVAAEIPKFIRKYLYEKRNDFDKAHSAADAKVKELTGKSGAQSELTAARSKAAAYNRLAKYPVENMQSLSVNLLQEKFRQFWENEKASQGPREQTYRRFRARGGALRDDEPRYWSMDAWDEALEVFVTEAQKTTMEKIDDRNREEVFLASLGLERNMGQSQARLDAFAREMQGKVVDLLTEANDISMMGVYFTAGTIPALKTNKNFLDIAEKRDKRQNNSSMPGGSSNSAPQNASAADIIRHWEIVGDIAKRLAAVKINSLEEFSYINLQGKESGGCNYYTYNISVIGSMGKIRALLNNFANAYKDNRMYVVSRVTLKKQEDQVQDIIDVAQGILGDKGEEAAKLAVKEENAPENIDNNNQQQAKIIAQPTYFKETGNYPECVAGRSDLCTASIVLNYVVYNANILK